MLFGRRTEDGEDERHTATDRLGAVESGGGGKEELLRAVGGLPGGHGGAIEVDYNGVTGGKSGGEDIVGKVDGRLREEWRRRDRRRLVLAVHGE